MKLFFLLILFISMGLIFTIEPENDSEKKDKYIELDKIVTKYLDQIAVSVVPLDDPKSASYYKNKERKYVSASMIKLLILSEFIEQLDDKVISLDSIYILRKEDIVGGDGIMQNMTVGTEFTYDTLALYMIKYSDNTATNVLIDILEMDKINEKAKKLNLKSTELNRKMMKWNGTENYISAEDTETMLKGILYKTIGSKEMCEKCIEYLLANSDYDGVPEGIPKDVKYAHKTGSLTKIRHDGGIVFAKKPYIIIVLTQDFVLESEANDLMREISRTAYDIVQKSDPEPSSGQNYLKVFTCLILLALLLLF